MKVKWCLYILGTAITGLHETLAAAAQITVSNLQVENKVAPVGIDVKPRFSWIVDSTQRGTIQTSYQILVSKSQAGNSDVWNSGVISSKKPYLIDYAGPALASDTRYYWSVNIATTAGSGAASSEFTTGFLSAADWSPSQWIGKPATGLIIPDSLASSFRSAQWIWTPESGAPNAPPGDRAFRKTYASPNGKTATSALILMTVDNQFTLYVNGVLAGSSPTSADVWKSSQRFSVPLNSGSNLFAVRATNLPDVSTGGANPAGLLAAIQINFSDGSTTTVLSDASWLATGTIPANFQSPSTSDSSWATAAVIAQYGSGPWANNVQLPSGDITPTISFSDSTWIWSAEAGPVPTAPAQPRAFRKTFQTLSGKTLKNAFILMTVDDGFTLYVNGVQIGTSLNQLDAWKSAQRFTVALSGSSTLFAVKATNLPDVGTGGPSPAGLLAAIQIVYTDGSSTVLLSDTTWKVSSNVAAGFEQPSFSDSSWSNAIGVGQYGAQPWATGVTYSDAVTEHPAPLIRKEFSIAKTVSFARLYYAVGGYASITLNGAPASDLVLTPGFTTWDKQVQYVVIGVASKLKSGTNAIGVELGRGHYGVTNPDVWSWTAAPWHAEPTMRAVLSIGYTDGTTTRIVTDSSWQTIEGPTRLDDIFGGENYDASYRKPGFDTAGFSAAGWVNALVVSGPKGVLLRARQPPTRIIQSLIPVSVSQPLSGIYVVAFERVVAGWAKITVTGPAKTLITLHFGEKLNPDGTVLWQDTDHLYVNNFQTDRIWLAGTGKPEVFEPKFSYKGYQYVQIEGWPGSAPTTANIVGQVVHDDLLPRGSFTSSSDILNKLHNAAVATMLNNVHSIPEDCPTYEKNGWSGDAMLGTEMFLTNLGADELLAKYVRDLAESRPNGQGPPSVIAPDSNWGQNNQAPPWHSAFIFIPYWLYQYRGDRRVLEEHYDAMKNYVGFELGRSPNNIASTGLGDWVTPESNPRGGNPPEDNRISATAFLYKMLTTMNQVATVLGNTADASTFSSQAAAVKTAFNSAFLHSGQYSGVGDSGYRQTHNLLAIAFGLTPDAGTAQSAADSVSLDVVSRGNHLNTGALGTKYLLPVLTNYLHGDTAFAVAQQQSYPSWGYWIANGATTTWEHWKLEARSHDHLFLGTYDDWFFRHVAGIQITGTAYETVTISPLLIGQLTSARAWTITPFGNLTVDWTNSGGSWTVNVGIPVSVTATVIVPLPTTLQKILESGKQLPRQGVTVLSSNSTGIHMSVSSGKYSFNGIVAK